MKVTMALVVRKHGAKHSNFTDREITEVSLEEVKKLIGYKFFTLKDASRAILVFGIEMTQITDEELRDYMLRHLHSGEENSALLGYHIEGSPEELLDLLESYFKPRQKQ